MRHAITASSALLAVSLAMPTHAAAQGDKLNAYGNPPAEISAWMTREIARWQDVARAANIKAE